jgi:hypothetical protein
MEVSISEAVANVILSKQVFFCEMQLLLSA